MAIHHPCLVCLKEVQWITWTTCIHEHKHIRTFLCSHVHKNNLSTTASCLLLPNLPSLPPPCTLDVLLLCWWIGAEEKAGRLDTELLMQSSYTNMSWAQSGLTALILHSRHTWEALQIQQRYNTNTQHKWNELSAEYLVKIYIHTANKL